MTRFLITKVEREDRTLTMFVNPEFVAKYILTMTTPEGKIEERWFSRKNAFDRFRELAQENKFLEGIS